MAVAPVRRHGLVSTESGGVHSRLARWAVGLSVVFGAAFASSVATVVIAYVFGSEGAIEDNWLGMVLAAVASVGLLGSLAAFVLAIAATIRRERWSLLWAPLCAFPAFVAFLALGEAFWWE